MCATQAISTNGQQLIIFQVISLSDIFISPLEDMYEALHIAACLWLTTESSYFVTELLGTDLHRLLTSRPLEKQFIQYFLYQILVCTIESNYCVCD